MLARAYIDEIDRRPDLRSILFCKGDHVTYSWSIFVFRGVQIESHLSFLVQQSTEACHLRWQRG